MRQDRGVSEVLERHRRLIHEQGWSVVTLGGEGRRALPYAHTVGLTRLGHPELLVSGRAASEAEYLLNTLGDEVLAGHRFHVGDALQRGPWPPMRLLRVSSADALVMTRVLDGGDPSAPALQAVWSDGAGHWPWELGWAPGTRQQQLFARVPKVAEPRVLT